MIPIIGNSTLGDRIKHIFALFMIVTHEMDVEFLKGEKTFIYRALSEHIPVELTRFKKQNKWIGYTDKLKRGGWYVYKLKLILLYEGLG
jgi:hypothetical protein